MPNWNEGEYTKIAETLAAKSASSQRPLTDVVEKFAREAKLNPDEIRTLTTMSNVAFFKIAFKEKTGADRQTEFPVGDAEAIIGRIQDNPAPPQSATESASKTASYDVWDLRPEGPLQEKVAAYVEPAPKPVSRASQVKAAARLRESFVHERIIKHAAWVDQMNQVATAVRQRLTPTEKTAFIDTLLHYNGPDAALEITGVCELARFPTPDLNPTKIANLVEFTNPKRVPEADVIKSAMDAREKYLFLGKSIEKLDQMFPELSQ